MLEKCNVKIDVYLLNYFIFMIFTIYLYYLRVLWIFKRYNLWKHDTNFLHLFLIINLNVFKRYFRDGFIIKFFSKCRSF